MPMRLLAAYSDVPIVGRVYPMWRGCYVNGKATVLSVRLMTSPLSKRYLEALVPCFGNKEIHVGIPADRSLFDGELLIGYNHHDDQIYTVTFRWNEES